MKSIKITAAVIEKIGAPFVLQELELDGPRADEILVRIIAVGICQTDVHVRDRVQTPGCRWFSGTKARASWKKLAAR